jgi:hypothetical protein
MAVAGIVVCMLSISAAAYSDASLSTNSLLRTEGSELSAALLCKKLKFLFLRKEGFQPDLEKNRTVRFRL